MENFIVSARKYRPATFDMIVGQDTITSTLKSAIIGKRLAQAYLFCGPRGVGKTTCARILAKTINCLNLKDNAEACDECESCISFNTLRSFNIHELDAASNNKVEDIRSLNEQVRIPPQLGKYSIYIIDEVHMLSSSAFNAFLKTLEEPPAHAIFILATTEKHKIIPTILSRCQVFDFNRIRVEDIVKRLVHVAGNEDVKIEEEALHAIARKADGALRDALSIFDQLVSLRGKTVTYKDVVDNLNLLDQECYFKCVDGALANDISSVLVTFNEILNIGFDGHNFISGLNSHFRDLLVCRDETTVNLIEAAPSVRKRYLEQAGRCPVDFLLAALELGSACDMNYKNSKNQRLHAELFLIQLCRLTGPLPEETVKKKPVDESNENLKSVFSPPAPDKDTGVTRSPVPKQHPVPGDNTPTHVPAAVKPVRSFSIKEVISGNGDSVPGVSRTTPDEAKSPGSSDTNKMELTGESFMSAWSDFIDNIKDQGPRVLSMFKTITPEILNGNTIRIHLSNAAQRDFFVQDYRQHLINFIHEKFVAPDVDIETTIGQSESGELPYSDEQKYNYMLKKFPALREFRKAFNLDFT
jgi:DNA polymerase-3 subunit gamma/tau